MKASHTTASATACPLLLILPIVAGALVLAACGSPSRAANTSPSPLAANTSASLPSAVVAEAIHNEVPSHTSGLIAFVKDLGKGHSGDSYICVVRPDGTGLRQLTHHKVGVHQGKPAWSPDGRRIAFLTGDDAVWVMKADGSHQRRVTAAHLGITELAWSPDGRRMALTLHDQSNGHVGLAVMNADGSGFRRLFWEREPASYDNPVWAADGRIFFARSDNSELREISSVKPDGSGLTVVSAAGRADSFSLSHDGKWLLIFDSEQRFAVRMAADGRGGEQVVLGKDQWEKYLAGAKGWPIASSWSPEGRWVAVAASAVQTMGLVSSGLWVVKSDSYSRPFLLSGAGMKVFDPAWQPR